MVKIGKFCHVYLTTIKTTLLGRPVTVTLIFEMGTPCPRATPATRDTAVNTTASPLLP